MQGISRGIVNAYALAGLGLSLFMFPYAAHAQQCDSSVTIAAGEVRRTPLVFSGIGCTDRTVICEGTGESRGKILGIGGATKLAGVYIHSGAREITISNCIIEKWEVGIKLGIQDAHSQGANHRIWHNTLRHNTKDGLDCDGSSANDYWDNEAYNNRENGFEFDYCHQSNDWGAPYIYENNRAHHNGKHGFSFDNSDNHRLHANWSYCNGWQQAPDADGAKLRCSGPRAGENGHEGWESTCDGIIYGHGLRIDSSDCKGVYPSTGIQADWNNWGDRMDRHGDYCFTNAIAGVTSKDYAILRGSTYDNMQNVYGYNTNHCGP